MKCAEQAFRNKRFSFGISLESRAPRPGVADRRAEPMAERPQTTHIETMSFDTLSYDRRLKQAGVPEAQAEAFADATRELAFQDFATKGDLAGVKGDLTMLRSELAAAEQRVMAAIETMASASPSAWAA